jgi:two-component system OmpR family sensor kinase
MGRIESEGARMGKLVEDLLLLARLDQGRPLKREPVDLATLVDDAATDARAVEPRRPISYERPAAAWVTGDPDRLRQVIDNLLANVRVHTDGAVPVVIDVTVDDDDVTLRVIDTGPGINPEDAERVFDRFYRADSSRSRARGGAGLGLSIVASIVEAHDGQVRIASSATQGTSVIVRLPRAAIPQYSEQRMAAPVGDG